MKVPVESNVSDGAGKGTGAVVALRVLAVAAVMQMRKMILFSCTAQVFSCSDHDFVPCLRTI